MSNSPPGAKGSRASSGGKRSAAGGGQKSTPGKNKNKNKKSAFGFTSHKKKRPANDTTTSAACASSASKIRGGGAAHSSSTASAVKESPSSSDVEIIITSPSKKARRATTGGMITATATTSNNKIGKGKENGTKKKATSTTTGVASSTKSATPAAKNNGDKQRKASNSNSVNSNASSTGTGTGSRVALLDLTQDSSSDSMDKKQPAAVVASKSAPGDASSSAAAAGGSKQQQTKSKVGTSTLSMTGSLADTLANTLVASTATNKQYQQQQQKQQRRGKRDKSPSKRPQQGGVKRSQGGEPIEILDESIVVTTAPTTTINTSNKKKKVNNIKPKFTVGEIVNVQDRTWPGRNDPGGVAKILKIHENDQKSYDVKYVLESRKEKNVEESYITKQADYESPDKKCGRNGFATKLHPTSRTTTTTPDAMHVEENTTLHFGGFSVASSEMSQSSPKKMTSPKKTLPTNADGEKRPRGDSITAHFSPKSSPNQDQKKKKKARVKSPMKKKLTSPPRPPAAKPNALGLVRVIGPNQIACTTAVARAKDQPFHHNNNSKTTTSDDAKRVFPGAILGRSSSKTKSTYVDIGIPNGAAGISRNHVRILSVKGLLDDETTTIVAQGEDHHEESQQSQASTTSSIASSHVSQHPSMIIQVDAKSTNGVTIYRTRRGQRGETYLGQGMQANLRIGDAISFRSSDDIPFCVVGLTYPNTINDRDNEVKATNLLNVVRKEGDGATWSSLNVVPKETKKTNGLPVKGDSNNGKKQTGEKQDSAAAEKNSDKKQRSGKTGKTLDIDCDEDIMEIVETKSSGQKSEPDLDVTMELEGSQSDKKEMPSEEGKTMIPISAAEESAPSIQKGDEVKVLYDDVPDMFGDSRKEWYFGKVTKVESKQSSTSSSKIVVHFDDNTSDDTFQYPSEEVEKLSPAIPSSELFPETFVVGDIVDARFQNGNFGEGRWDRGRVASVNGSTCDILYYDSDYESNVPTNEKKIRLVSRSDPTNADWLIGKTALLTRDSNGNRSSRTGTVSQESDGGNRYKVTFSDGSSESISYAVVAEAVLANLRKNLPSRKQHIWPVSNSSSMAETVRARRQRRETSLSTDEYGRPLPEVKVKEEPNTKSRRTRASKSTSVVVKAEPVEDDGIVFDEVDTTGFDGEDLLELYIPEEGGPAIDPSVLENRKVAKEFPPGLPNMLWCALNSAESQTGSNFLRDLLCAHDMVPPSNTVGKLMELMKYGPKAEGSSVHFKDPYRTELATQYVYGLLWASRRLVKSDSGALFGPSRWDDIEVLLSQSITQTENMISGQRLAQSLQMAARGAKLLSMMLLTELQGRDLYSTTCTTPLDSMAMQSMPTVRLVRMYGVRSALKIAVQFMTKSLVRHSRWIMDSGGVEPSTAMSATKNTRCDESCSLEARVCLDNLGTVVSVIAWLFCVEERVGIDDPSVAFVIKDAFLVEVERSLEDVPEMNAARKKKQFAKKCSMYFLMSMKEEFATRMVETVEGMIG